MLSFKRLFAIWDMPESGGSRVQRPLHSHQKIQNTDLLLKVSSFLNLDRLRPTSSEASNRASGATPSGKSLFPLLTSDQVSK